MVGSIHTEKEVRKTISFIITSKIFQNNLTKKIKVLYNEKFNTLKNEIEDTRCKDLLHSLIGRINVVKMAIISKAIYRFNTFHIKILTLFFTEAENGISKFIWKYKNIPRVAQITQNLKWKTQEIKQKLIRKPYQQTGSNGRENTMSWREGRELESHSQRKY